MRSKPQCLHTLLNSRRRQTDISCNKCLTSVVISWFTSKGNLTNHSFLSRSARYLINCIPKAKKICSSRSILKYVYKLSNGIRQQLLSTCMGHFVLEHEPFSRWFLASGPECLIFTHHNKKTTTDTLNNWHQTI